MTLRFELRAEHVHVLAEQLVQRRNVQAQFVHCQSALTGQGQVGKSLLPTFAALGDRPGCQRLAPTCLAFQIAPAEHRQRNSLQSHFKGMKCRIDPVRCCDIGFQKLRLTGHDVAPLPALQVVEHGQQFRQLRPLQLGLEPLLGTVL